MVIAYVHDGTSVYDSFFLEYLTSNNTVYFLTFNQSPKFTGKAKVIKMNEPFLTNSTSVMGWVEGPRMYLLAFLRALVLAVHLRRLKPKVVFACMATKYGFYTALSRFRPYILLVWGTDVLVAPKRLFFARFLARFSLGHADAVILDSSIQENAALSLGCSREKIVRFPWFDVASVRIEVPREEIREKLGWADNSVVVCTRSHEPVYGVEYLVEAIPHVLKQVPESRFLIIGKGQMTRLLMEKVKELNVEGYVKFLGSLPRGKVISYVNASDLNVSPSFSDGTSASLLEAMALGIPSVATNIPGNREWIENGKEGCLVPLKDSQRLADAIVSLLKNAQARKKIGERARKKVYEKTDWHANSQMLHNLIANLVKSR